MLNATLAPTLFVWSSGWLRIEGGVVTMLVSTNQLEPLNCPPVTKPRARRVALAGMETPVSRQPPVMRVPAPRLTQSVPLVQASKLVRQTSGLLPPRSQVRVDPSQD